MRSAGRFVERLLAHTLSFALSVVIILGVLATTAGTPQFWLDAAQQSQLYTGLAAAVPDTSAAQFQQALEPLVPRLIDYYGNGGPAPELNPAMFLPDSQAGSAVAPIALETPADTHVRQIIGYLHIAFTVAAVAIGLLVILIAIFYRGRSWAVLARAALWSGLGSLLSAAAFLLLPTLANSALNQAEIAPVRPVLVQFAATLGHAISLKLAVVGAGLIGLAVVLAIIGRLLQLRAKFAPKTPPAPGPDTPVRKI